MKYLICFLLAFISLDGLNAQIKPVKLKWGTPKPQQATAWQGDSNFRVQVVSYDTSKVKVYDSTAQEPVVHMLYMHGNDTVGFLWEYKRDKAKYDTIGPQLRLVSGDGYNWNPASAMWVYEVRKYVPSGFWGISEDNPKQHDLVLPKHYEWLDSKKKPLKLTVWSSIRE